jgi:hypothetical protein
MARTPRDRGFAISQLQRQVADLAFPLSGEAELSEQENVFDRCPDRNATAHLEDPRHSQVSLDPLVHLAGQR